VRRVLLLAHRLPYPPDKGDKIRSWHFLQHLAGKAEIHLGCLVDRPDDMRHLDRLRALCANLNAVPIRPWLRRLASARGIVSGEPLTFPYFGDRRLLSWARSTAKKAPIDVAFAYSTAMAPLIAPGVLEAGSRVVDMIDLDSAKWREYGAMDHGVAGLVWRREARLLASAECKIARWADATILATEAEASDLRRACGSSRAEILCVGNGVDTRFFSPAFDHQQAIGTLGSSSLIVFTGAMDYRPNIDAVVWFADEILPLIRRRHPGVVFTIVGSSPAAPVRRLAERKDAMVTGRVEDVRPWLAHAALVVAPLRIARGIQNKVLEGMAMARPVVCTSAAARGIDAMAGRDLLVADDPASFSAAATGLLDDPARAAAMGEAGRRLVETAYGWPARLAELDRVLELAEAAKRDRHGRGTPMRAGPRPAG
jgi:sugar transferase (PEP-CTERM/EpsH1 system associated)